MKRSRASISSSARAMNENPQRKVKKLDYCLFSIDEIVATILQYSSTTEFFACLKYINKCFYNVIERGLLSGLIFKTIYLDSSLAKPSGDNQTLRSILLKNDCFSKRSILKEEKLLEIIERSNFAIREWYSTNCLQVSEKVCHELFTKVNQLTSVHIESSNMHQFLLNPSWVPNLKHLILTFKSIKFKKISLYEGFKDHFENLKYLSITVHLRDDSFVMQLGNHFPKLKHFQFHTLPSPCYNNSETTSHSQHYLLTPNIKSISLKTSTYTLSFNGKHLDSYCDKFKFSNLPNLKKLTVNNFSREEEKGIHILDCPVLDTLGLAIKQETLCTLTLPKLSLLQSLELDIQSHLDFSESTFSTWLSYLMDLSIFKSIRKIRVYSSNSSSISNWVVKDCRTLRNLSVDISSISLVIENMEKLKYVEIRSSDLKLTIKNTKIEDDEMANILDNSIISNLTLDNCSKLSTIDLSKNSRSCKFFSLSNCNDLKSVKCNNSLGGEIRDCKNVKHIYAPSFSINRANINGKSKALLVTGVHPNMKVK